MLSFCYRLGKNLGEEKARSDGDKRLKQLMEETAEGRKQVGEMVKLIESWDTPSTDHNINRPGNNLNLGDLVYIYSGRRLPALRKSI